MADLRIYLFIFLLTFAGPVQFGSNWQSLPEVLKLKENTR